MPPGCSPPAEQGLLRGGVQQEWHREGISDNTNTPAWEVPVGEPPSFGQTGRLPSPVPKVVKLSNKNCSISSTHSTPVGWIKSHYQKRQN